MLDWATGYFAERNVDQPRLSIEWLLAHVLGMPRLNLYLQFDRPLTGEDLERLRDMVRRRARHEPLQYIVGTAPFHGREFHVGPGVLIPRPETEELVEWCISALRGRKDMDGSIESGGRQEHGQEHGVERANDAPLPPLRILDLGTGSGCIAVTLALELPGAEVHAVELSAEALVWAERNARELGASVTFHQGDMARLGVSGPAGPWDLIVSNPPYVLPEEADSLDPQVRTHEPHAALFHERPLDLLGSLLDYAARALSPGGHLAVELNPALADRALQMARMLLPDSRLKTDLSGKDRFLVGAAPTRD